MRAATAPPGPRLTDPEGPGADRWAPDDLRPPEEAGWTLELVSGGDPRLARRHDSLATLSSGALGVRGDLADARDAGGLVLVAGTFGRGPDGLVRPLPGPLWTDVGVDRAATTGRRVLDMRDATLWQEDPERGLRSLRFASLALPGVAALRAEDRRQDRPWPPPLGRPAESPLAAEHRTRGRGDGPEPWVEAAGDRATVTAAARERTWTTSDRRGAERVVAFAAAGRSTRTRASDLVDAASEAGVDALLRDHRRAWARRWAGADIEVVGDPGAQLAVRFALSHLLSCAATEGEAAVGARGLTGLAYAGHVFWDADVFVLPALAAILPDAARAMVEYRIRRLPAARARAAAEGRRGARFPWESADTGEDVTPRSMRDISGRLVPVHTGARAEHINADVAWAALHLAEWTGASPAGDGIGDLVLETARHWADRIRRDGAGRGHIDDVIGPDEYHEQVDDDAYTNGMARWHLRRAATLTADRGAEAEASRFSALADSLVDGFDPATGRHEQFAGFDDLEPLLIGDVAIPPIAADLLLGRERIGRTQVVKQPDVLMLHHLLPDHVPPGSLTADLDHYLPRTAHGSSLSPATCAALLARDGRADEALALFDLAARMDLDDLTGTTSGGLHLATMGGLWQAVVHGFAGIRPTGGRLGIAPCLPSRWEALRIRLHYRGEQVLVAIDHRHISVEVAHPVPVVIEGRPTWAPVEVGRTRRPRRSP